MKAREGIWWDSAAIALLIGTAIVVLGASVFPTEDGPVHLYYVDVLRDLLTHSGTYARHFEIKSFLTPYALEYCSLLVLETVFSPILSEKLLICGYIFAFGLGFRYLVGSVAGRNNPWTLAGLAYCMNALVYRGFLNYCMGVALALFLSGLWIRHGRQLGPRHIAMLLVGFTLMLFTHPVPVAVVLLFAGVHVAVDVGRAISASGLWWPSLHAHRRPLTTIFVLAGGAAAWVSLFVNHNPSQQVFAAAASEAVPSGGWMKYAAKALKLPGIAPFTSPIYCLALVLPLAVAALVCIACVRKRGGRIPAFVIPPAAAAALCFAVFCFGPASVNGASFFRNRFAIFAVLYLLVAAAALHPPRLWSRLAGTIALCVTGALLPVQWVNVSRIAREMRPILEAPPGKDGGNGLMICETQGNPEGLSFDPYLWAGVHYFRRSKAILWNAPWMDLPTIMIRPVKTDRWSYQDPQPEGLLLANVVSAGDTVPDLNFLVIQQPPGPRMEALLSRLSWNTVLADGGVLRIFAR